MALFGKDGDINMTDLEEALAMLRLKRERGFSTDYLLNIDHLTTDLKTFTDLQKKYTDVVAELQKTMKMLEIQEEITQDYKKELEQLQLKIQALQNEYELRLEEDARLLDLRANKIAALESQLQNIVYGAAKIPPHSLETTQLGMGTETDIELRNGQNRIEFQFEGASLSMEGYAHIQRLFPDLASLPEGPNGLTTFLYMDFFEFEIEPSPLGIGLKPVYNHTSRYTVFVDDFFLWYLQRQSVIVRFCRANGVQFTEIGQW